MLSCRNCGAQAMEDPRFSTERQFCPNCGGLLEHIDLAQTVQGKNPRTAVLLAALLGVILMGLGQIYVMKIKRGLLLMTLGLVTGMVFFIAVLGGFFEDSFMIALMVGIARLALWAWQIHDARLLAKVYNEGIANTGKPPW